jgi:hypothetical protein
MVSEHGDPAFANCEQRPFPWIDSASKHGGFSLKLLAFGIFNEKTLLRGFHRVSIVSEN